MSNTTSQKCKRNQQCIVPGFCCHHSTFTCTKTLSCIDSHLLHSCSTDKQCPTGCCNYITKICTNDNLRCIYDGTVPNACETNSNCLEQGVCCNKLTHLCGKANCITADGKRGYRMTCQKNYQCASNCCDRETNQCVFNTQLCQKTSNGGRGGLDSLGFGLVAGGIFLIIVLFCVILFIVCRKKKSRNSYPIKKQFLY